MKKIKKLFINYFNRILGMTLFLSVIFTGMGFTKKSSEKVNLKNKVDDFSLANVAEVVINVASIESRVKYENTNDLAFNISIKNEITRNDSNVVLEKELTNEEKIEVILKKYNLTIDEFDIIVAIVLAEAKANSYDDAYAVINTIYNRTKSIKWNYSVDAFSGEDAGLSLYYQAIHPGQFVVYESGAYSNFLGEEVKNLEGYQAVIDMLYEEKIMHDFLNFLSSVNTNSNRTQFVDGGNNYYGLLESDDILESELNSDEDLKLELVR